MPARNRAAVRPLRECRCLRTPAFVSLMRDEMVVPVPAGLT